MTTPYTDYLHLSRRGRWPTDESGVNLVPDWVQEICEKIDCYPTSCFVQMHALEWQIAHMLTILQKIESEIRNEIVRCQIIGSDPEGPAIAYWKNLHAWIKEEIEGAS